MSDIVMEAKEISRTYAGAVPVPALKPCSLQFKKGEFCAVIGKSGSGKSTLLRILATLDTPDTGELYIHGEKVIYSKSDTLAKLRRRKVGFIYQDYNLFPEYTAYENIIMPIHLDGRDEDREKILALMEQLDILDCKDKFPHEMSGGEQQRISIARALSVEPAVVLADEPTGNLDAENADKIAGLLRQASEIYEQTIIMVTHDAQMAEYADRIIQIKDGKLT
ncbi:MAG: ABC transporter ATP-binding protein [Lachnospiraceae bacterium]|nr:ABC transporter ATP-binding protein [Lachnospiraceae bacterium]